MLNLEDTIINQKIIYKLWEIDIYPREYIPSDELPLGYSKVISNYIQIGRDDIRNNILNNKQRGYFSLKWDLIFSEEKFLELMRLYNSYLEDFNIDINNSINIYLPNINICESIKLEDNRIIDYYTNSYQTYNIIITSISEIEEFFFKEKLVKFRIEAETI